jgi:hypothetical protein
MNDLVSVGHNLAAILDKWNPPSDDDPDGAAEPEVATGVATVALVSSHKSATENCDFGASPKGNQGNLYCRRARSARRLG